MLILFLHHDAIYPRAPCDVLTHVGRICHSVAISCWNASSRDLAVLAKLSKHHELHRGVRDNGQTTWRSTFCCQLHSKIKGLSSLTPLWPVPIQRGSSKFIVTESFERIAKYPLERRYFICLKTPESQKGPWGIGFLYLMDFVSTFPLIFTYLMKYVLATSCYKGHFSMRMLF